MPVGSFRSGLLVALLAAVLSCAGLPKSRGQAPADPKAEEMVSLNFPKEVEVGALIDYVSQRLGVKILYDDQGVTGKINIKAPGEIPASSLLGVLESALKMKNLALVDADIPGWKRIVTTDNMLKIAPSGDAAEAMKKYGNMAVVTQTFQLKHVNPETVKQMVEPFLTKPDANSMVLPDARTLVVTDYVTNLLKIARWIEFADQPRPAISMEFVSVRHLEAADLAKQITSLLSARANLESGAQTVGNVELTHDDRTNQLVVIGQQEAVDQVRQLAGSLDVPLGLTTRTYAFQNVAARRVDELIQQMFDPVLLKRAYRSAVDEEDNLLIVTTIDEIHQRIEGLKASRDVPVAQAQSPIRFHKVENVPVGDLLETIRAIATGSQTLTPPTAAWQSFPTDGRIRPAREHAVPGPNLMPSGSGTELVQPPAVHLPAVEPEGSGLSPPVSVGTDSALDAVGGDIHQLLARANVTADARTNTLIVVAEPSIQRLYADLIERLDQRPAQVLIEAKFVILDTTDDFSLGVEVSGGDRSGLKRLLAFSSYGLSSVDPVTGALSLIPGMGFNGTLVDPDVADAVLRTLTNHSRARVLSAPRILVNDNASGQLNSVEEVPFTSVNASQTVATTSFAGFAEAGTTINVTPRISDGSHLVLDFSITVNTFTGTGGGGVPPPRQTEEVTTQVTIPDGHTVIVGGLRRSNRSYKYTGLPLLDQIPLVREITGLTVMAKASSCMFVFIRPVVLRDDKFRDLKFLSEKDVCHARVRQDYPRSKPTWIQCARQ